MSKMWKKEGIRGQEVRCELYDNSMWISCDYIGPENSYSEWELSVQELEDLYNTLGEALKKLKQ